MKTQNSPIAIETEKIKATYSVVKAIGDTIKEAGAIPAGHLYAILSQFGCTQIQFDNLIDSFKNSGKVKEMNNLLYWVG